MLLVKTYLDNSPIHGIGVFAGEPIPKGTKVWTFADGFDRCFTERQFRKLPKPAREFIGYYGYRVDGEIILTCDNDRYTNHSDNANTHWHRGFMRARRAIAKGEEITNDYREFDPGLCAAFLSDK